MWQTAQMWQFSLLSYLHLDTEIPPITLLPLALAVFFVLVLLVTIIANGAVHSGKLITNFLPYLLLSAQVSSIMRRLGCKSVSQTVQN